MRIDAKMSLQTLCRLQDTILLERLEMVLPRLMEETKTDMWLVIGDEYNEGPTVASFLPSSFHHARRTAAFIFSRHKGEFKRFIVSKPDFTIDRFYEPVLLKPKDFDWESFYKAFASRYDLEYIRSLPEEDLWSCIGRMVRELKPRHIAIEVSEQTPFADGLSKSNYDRLAACLDEDYRRKLRPAEPIVVRWLETRTEREIELMRHITKTTRSIIHTCYSRKVITPGHTTIADARFYLMEQATKKGMLPWFDATVWIRRKGKAHLDGDYEVIREGDLLHCDFGVRYGNLCSDVQEMAYVKSAGDATLIDELTAIHRKAMRVQDILAETFAEGKTGNEVLSEALAKARGEGIVHPMIYSHPIGIYGHGPGPTIGSFGNQQFVTGSGERIIHDSTCYAMELNVMERVPSWDDMQIMYGQEIDILFKDGKVEFFAGRQEKLRLI